MTTLDLLNEVVAMGFDREYALENIDGGLDELFGFENRKPIAEEILKESLYQDILDGFETEMQERNN